MLLCMLLCRKSILEVETSTQVGCARDMQTREQVLADDNNLEESGAKTNQGRFRNSGTGVLLNLIHCKTRYNSRWS